MGYQDREYFRSDNGPRNPLMWLLNGSVPLFTAFGIRVRAHAVMVIYAVLVLLFGLGRGFTVEDRVINVTVLFAIVLLHEFGHCFTARWVGGEAEDILMHPLGGLAMARPPRRPLPTFLTVAGGPAVNVLLMILSAVVLYVAVGKVPWKPYWAVSDTGIGISPGWWNIVRYAYWIYQINYILLALNLLPIFPLDGGQMLQAALWPKMGYRKSMLFACNTGMIGAAIGGAVSLTTLDLNLVILAAWGFMTCYQMKQQMQYAEEEYDDGIDYSAAYDINAGRTPTKVTQRVAKRAMKEAKREKAEQIQIDAILAKVSASGMNSLSWSEKRALQRATDNQRKRDAARGRYAK